MCRAGEDLSGWLEYCAEGLRQTLERTWLRVQALTVKSSAKLVLRPRQGTATQAAPRSRKHDTGGALGRAWRVAPGRDGSLNPLLEAGLVERVGTRKSGRYTLRQP